MHKKMQNARTAAGILMTCALVSLSSGCASGGNQMNPAYFKGGQWTGVRGGALVENPIVCRTASAKDAGSFVEAIEISLIPKLFQGLGISAPKTDVLEANDKVCSQLSSIRKSTLEVLPATRATVTSAFTSCPSCTSVVVPYFYVNDVPVVAELKSRDGTVLATTETKAREADGKVYARVLVFAKNGDLMFYGGSDYVTALGTDGLRARAAGMVESMMVGFPREVLADARTPNAAP